MDEEKKEMNFSKFSPTMMATYLKCPRMFKYKYIDKLGEKFKQPRPYLSFGNSIHKTLDEFMRRKPQERSFKLLKAILETQWESEGFINAEQEEEFFHRAVEMLNNFYEAGEYKLQPDFVEQWFEFPVEDFILSGRIDRIDGEHVIDYKTGNYVPNIEELKNDVQTIVYLHGAHHIISKPAQSIIYYYLASNQKIQITKTPDEIKQDLEKIKDIVRRIRTDKEFFPTPHRVWCLYCDFNTICPLAGMSVSEINPQEIGKLMMEKSEQAYATLYEILRVSTVLGGILDFDAVTRQVIEIFRTFAESKKIALFLKSSQTGKFYLRGLCGIKMEAQKKIEEILIECPRILEGRMPVILRDEDVRGRFLKLFSVMGISQEASVVFIPFFAREKQIGAIIIEGYQEFTDRDLIVLKTLSNIAQISLDNAIHYTQAIIDDLTGLYVRKYFEGRLAEEIERFKRFKTPFVLCMFDLDHFKNINDTYGHLFGDKILYQFARILKKNLRKIDIVARYGGEEFIALLPETDITSGFNVATRIREEIERKQFGDERRQVNITTSVGVLPVPPELENQDDYLRAVDEALYMAKQSGRNCVKIYGNF